jgi:type IV pilus assembly protein PilQ
MLELALALAFQAAAAEPEEARVSIDVKDAAIQDVVRLLAELGSFQVVMDPGVSCRLTLKLKEVRWGQVLDSALKSCGLAHEEDGGIVRIAPAARMIEEAEARRRLSEARQAARARSVFLKRLSYARAEELAPIVKKMLSPHGEVVYDKRTNTLIIID